MKKQALSFLLRVNYGIRSDLFKLRKLSRAVLEVAEMRHIAASAAVTELRHFLHDMDYQDMQLLKKILQDTENLDNQKADIEKVKTEASEES